MENFLKAVAIFRIIFNRINTLYQNYSCLSPRLFKHITNTTTGEHYVKLAFLFMMYGLNGEGSSMIMIFGNQLEIFKHNSLTNGKLKMCEATYLIRCRA